MKAEEIEARLNATLPPMLSRGSMGPAPAAFAMLVPPEPADEPEADQERRRVAPDPAIPSAYQGRPEALLDRCAERLRKAVICMPASQRYGALFLGPSGCGKSSAAAWAVRRWRASAGAPAGRQALAWLDAIDATDAERRYRLGSGEPELLTSACRAEWLVVDDVGLSTSVQLVQLVLARRYQSGLPTIVTTGLEREQLVQHVGAATVRRMVEFQGRAGQLVDCHRGGAR